MTLVKLIASNGEPKYLMDGIFSDLMNLWKSIAQGSDLNARGLHMGSAAFGLYSSFSVQHSKMIGSRAENDHALLLNVLVLISNYP